MRNRRRDDFPRRRLREQPLSRLFPNMVTLAGLCCGLSAIRFAIVGRWELAVAFIIGAALIDGMDGRIARMLGATSVFGAQLDSLSDFVCFGVAPALIMYLWALHDVRGIGWAVTLYFAICTALRLARFNTALFDDNKQPWESKFFTGVPSPAGGILCLLPLVITLQLPEDFAPSAIFVASYMLIIGTLMVSRIPTFAGKNIRIKHDLIPFIMLLSAALIALFIIEPWTTISILSVLYLCSIFFSVRRWNKYKAASAVTDLHDEDGQGH